MDEAMTTSPDACAREVLEVVPLVMRAVRAEMRRHRGPGLSVPHFRALAFLGQNQGASLSAVAEHVGVRLPSASTLVAGLVERGLVHRAPSSRDRRQVTLALTARGRSTLEAARQAALRRLAACLEPLPARDRDTVVRGLEALRGVFGAPAPAGPD
jgi:DNA-binding MarR family transcriptional regulator